MTRVASLVLDGDTIKQRLQADRLHYGAPVHIDWLRFTVRRRSAPLADVDLLFPKQDNVWHTETRALKLSRLIASTPDADHLTPAGRSLQPDERGAALDAFALGERVVSALGPDFSLAVELRKGHDFYKFRWSIIREETEVGWIGFLASSSSPRQKKQAETMHVNLYGAACTFAAYGWRDTMADLITETRADITRADLALDFFDGIPGGFDSVRQDYESGACDVGGKRLKCNFLGDWSNNHGRSFYFGSKEAGKQTNVYEKGDQLYGVEAGSPWHRVELRYGNKLRELPPDLLRRPSDFFAGASDWHASTLLKAAHVADPEPVKCHERRQLETVEAEVTRNLRWTLNTAAPSLVAAMLHAGSDFMDLLNTTKLPGRLSKFKVSEIVGAFSRAIPKISVGEGFGHSLNTA